MPNDSIWTPIHVHVIVIVLLLVPTCLGQWSYLERTAINEIEPGSPCEYNRDCAIITTGLKCLRGGCHCEYFRAEPYLDWTHPYYNNELHKCVIRNGEVCVYNFTAAQLTTGTPPYADQNPRARALAIALGAGPGRRPATSPSSAWKDYHYTCEPGNWCDPGHPLLESRSNGVCVRGGAARLGGGRWRWVLGIGILKLLFLLFNVT